MPPLWLFSKPSFSIILGMSSKTGMENFFFLRTVFQTLLGISRNSFDFESSNQRLNYFLDPDNQILLFEKGKKPLHFVYDFVEFSRFLCYGTKYPKLYLKYI